MNKCFGVFTDPLKSTSGQRFFNLLANNLKAIEQPYSTNPSVLLFNVSTPIGKILLAKLKQQKVVLRIDSLYFDKLSPEFLAKFPWVVRKCLNIGLVFPALHNFFAFCANFLSENYAAFIRIILADHVIYQSKFSQKIHSHFFCKKPYSIIVNGAEYVGSKISKEIEPNGEKIRVVTLYDEWRPSKRIHELIRFIKWANEEAKVPIELTIIGYSGKTSICFCKDDLFTLENESYIKSIPKFKIFTDEMKSILLTSDAYLTFSFRDACPNTVVESMAYGLPVVAVASGGLPDIVGDAGVLIPVNDFENGFYCAHRYECDFPEVKYNDILEGVKKIIKNKQYYRGLVAKRFQDELSIEKVSTKYAAVLQILVDKIYVTEK